MNKNYYNYGLRKKYNEALEKARIINSGKYVEIPAEDTVLEYIFPELAESEDEKIRKKIIYLVKKSHEQGGYALHEYEADEMLAWLEKQGEKPQGKTALEAINEVKVDNSNSVSFDYEHATITQKDFAPKQSGKPRYGIGDVLCDKSCTTLDKDAQPNFEIVDIRNGMYICDKGSIPISQQDEYELVAKKIEQKEIEQEDEEYNGEDYGIDSLYHAQRILEKTLGKVESYQTDDGILSHKCAITAVKKLYKKKPTEWSEEDICNIENIDSIL